MSNKYSQYGEEFFLLEYFKEKTNGFVVEIGAADGSRFSNSRRLFELGWNGLLVEPNENSVNKIKSLHRGREGITIEMVGCGDVTETKIFNIDHNDIHQQISTFSKKQVEKCKKIYNCEFSEKECLIMKTQELFDKHNIKNIDFLSIDTESYDCKVIDGIEFSKTKIDLICVEQEDAKELLISKGYNLIHKTIGNFMLQRVKEQ